MAESLLAAYACDRCRIRKVSCSRRCSGCERCRDDNNVCTYSRSGVIRRNRKHETKTLVPYRPDNPRSSAARELTYGESRTLQSSLATDIEATRERLNKHDVSQQSSLGALSSLSEAYSAIWHDASEFDKPGKMFFLFEDHAASWTDVFVTSLERGRPIFDSPPPEVLDNLRDFRPQEVPRAWLVIYYSIILSNVSSAAPEDETTKIRLRSNLWLALNDVRLLLEPSEINIQALMMLACHVEEFTTPSLCWMLVTTACRMLQALGVTSRRLDNCTRERRILLFWYLNIIDKGLALTFGRAPSFHRAMAREVPLPTFDQLLLFEPHRARNGAPALFGAHFLHQILLVSQIMGDIWSYLYEENGPNYGNIDSVRVDLDSWHCQAVQILEAAALVEKPFLDSAGAKSIDLGLRTLTSQYHYLVVLISRSTSHGRAQCVHSSKTMLYSLKNMVSDSEEPYNGIVWQLLCCPFTAFLALFGEVLSTGEQSAEADEALFAMEQLPIFLRKMGERNSLAVRLERVATALMQHARSVVQNQELHINDATAETNEQDSVSSDLWPPTGHIPDWDTLFNGSTAVPSPLEGSLDGLDNDFSTWMHNFLGDGLIDWTKWDTQV